MSDFEVPEADALEQHETVGGDTVGGAVQERADRLGYEVPEADAAEQAAPAGAGVAERADRLGYEVPEADALEQAEPAADDAEDYREA